METAKATDPSTDLHPWVKLTQASLQKAKPGMYDLLLYPGIGRLNVEVSKDTISRSMLIWDRLLKTMESNGFKVRMTKEYPARTIVTVDGEPLSIRLRERISRSEHVPTAAEKERMEKLNLTPYATWDHRPSGKLILTIDYVTTRNDLINQVTWTDTEKKRIEDRLDSFTDVLVKVVKDMKIRWALSEERNRIWKEEERKRREAARRAAKEKKQRARLEKQASAWSLASAIRQFVQAVREVAARKNIVEPGGSLDKWIRWAERYAHEIDPVLSVLAKKCPVEKVEYSETQ